MFCQKCGARIDDDAKFCTACGAAVSDAAKPVEVPPINDPMSAAYRPYDQPLTEEAPAYQPHTSVYEPAFEAPTYEKPKKKRLLWLWILIVALVVTAAVSVAFVLFAAEGEKNYNTLITDYFDAFEHYDTDDIVDLFNKNARLNARNIAADQWSLAMLEEGGLDAMTALYGAEVDDTEETDVTYLSTSDMADVVTEYSLARATDVADVVVRAELSDGYFEGRLADFTFRMVKVSGRWTLLEITGADAGYASADDLAGSYFEALKYGDTDTALTMMSPAMLEYNGFSGSPSEVIEAFDGNFELYGTELTYIEESREELDVSELQEMTAELGIDVTDGSEISYTANAVIDGEESELNITLTLIKSNGAWSIAEADGNKKGEFSEWLDVVLAYYEYAFAADDEAVLSLFHPSIINNIIDNAGYTPSAGEMLEDMLDYWYSEYGLEMKSYEVYNEGWYTDAELDGFEMDLGIDGIEEGGDFGIYADMYDPDGNVYYYDYDFELFKVDGSWYILYIW